MWATLETELYVAPPVPVPVPVPVLVLVLVLRRRRRRQQKQFFNIGNRGGRRSSAGDIWQISGSPVAAATGGRRCVSGGTLGTISAIKRSFRRRIIISYADTRIRARPSSPFQRQLRGLNFQSGKYPKDFFGHPQGNTLSDINITREDIIDAIKIISQNSYGGHDEFPAILLKQCSKSLAHPLPLLYKASLKTGEIPTDLK